MSEIPDPFSRLVVALEPWLDQLVIIGGWTQQLYRFHPAVQEVDHPPLMTIDTDVAMPSTLPIREEDIRSRLLAHGFTEEFLGADRPPATHYHLDEESAAFYVEFLTPLTGSEYDRKGRRKATTEIAGVATQRLRHLEILLHAPWEVDFRSAEIAVPVRIANPVSFIAQKILIHDEREPEDRAKDLLYIYDTFQLFGARLDELQQLWRSSVSGAIRTRKAAKVVSGAAESLFGAVTDDLRSAAQIARERRLSSEAIRAACEYAFRQVFV